MDKIKLLSKVLIIVFFLGLLGLSAVTALVFFFSALFDETKGPEHVEKTEDHGIEFVAKTRNVTMDFPDLEIRHEFQLFAKRKGHMLEDKLEDSSFYADDEGITPQHFVPRAKVFDLDGMQYVAVFKKTVDYEYKKATGRFVLTEELARIVIFDPAQRMRQGEYQKHIWAGEDFDCFADPSLARNKKGMLGIKTVLEKLNQDTSCIDNIIDCFPDYTCNNNTVKVTENRGVAGKQVSKSGGTPAPAE